jgi:hypothetical protein
MAIAHLKRCRHRKGLSERSGSFQRVNRLLVTNRLYGPLVGGLIAYSVTQQLAPHHAPRDLFAGAAQILVVLMLAFAYQARLFRVRREPLPDAPWTVTLTRWFTGVTDWIAT